MMSMTILNTCCHAPEGQLVKWADSDAARRPVTRSGDDAARGVKDFVQRRPRSPALPVASGDEVPETLHVENPWWVRDDSGGDPCR